MKKKFIFSAITLATAGLVVGLSPKAFEATKAEVEWATSENWSVTNGAGAAGREALESTDGQVKLGTVDAFGVQYSKNEKVTLNGLEFTFVYDSDTAGDRAGFYFNQSKTFDYKGIVALVAPTRWDGQTRWNVTSNHDIDGGAGKTYTDMTGATPGFGGPVAPQIVTNYNADLEDGLHFKFEHVTKAWWKLTLTEIRGSYIWGSHANYVKDEVTGLASLTTYFKNSDMDLDDKDGAYLNVIGFNSGYCYIRDFVDGTYVEVAEDPATADEITAFKEQIEAMVAGYPEEFTTSMEAAKTAAIAHIDELTYPSEMQKYVDDCKAYVLSEYNKYLGYGEELDSSSAYGSNFVDPWGQGVFGKRIDDEGGVIVQLKSEWGARGQLVKQYDPLNFKAKINLSNLSGIFTLTVSPEFGSYVDEAKRYYTFEMSLVEGGLHVVLSTPATSAHNVSIEEWGTTNIGTFIGTTAEIGVDKNVSIKLSTTEGVTTVEVNNITKEIPSEKLGNGETAYFTVGTFSGQQAQYRIRVVDAASAAYASALPSAVESFQEYLDANEDEMSALLLEEYTDETYSQYTAKLAEFEAKLKEVGLDKYDADHFFDFTKSYTGGSAVYDAQVKAAIEAAKEMVNGYNLDDYREADKETVKNYKDSALAALAPEDPSQTPKTLQAVADISDMAKLLLDSVKTDAQLTLEEQKEEAKAEFDDVDLTIYRQAEKTSAEKIIADALTAIDAAADKDGIDAAVSAAKAALAALKTRAQYEAEELAAAKEAAVASINAKYAELTGAKQYTDANAASLLKIKDDAIAGINAATDVDLIAELAEAAIANMEAVEAKEAPVDPTPVDPDPVTPDQPSTSDTPSEEPAKKSGGCGGSVVAASALISLTALIGAGLLISKKRKDQ